mmetsp:Transcript_8145/g.25448  ORF Transcript_8145/g.25448 Transcript_8145/m.25448 type:complete len:559 (-) Transcript_8145:490-2166(-)
MHTRWFGSSPSRRKHLYLPSPPTRSTSQETRRLWNVGIVSIRLSWNSGLWKPSVNAIACRSWLASSSVVDVSPRTVAGMEGGCRCACGIGIGGNGSGAATAAAPGRKPEIVSAVPLSSPTSTGSPRPNIAVMRSDMGSPSGRGAMPTPLRSSAASSPMSSIDMTEWRADRCRRAMASPAATSSGVLPATLRVIRAPAPRSISHMSARPARAATCRALSPSVLGLSTCTPAASNVTTQEPMPRAAAAASGSSPDESATFGSARICSADLTPSSEPAAKADENATHASILGAASLMKDAARSWEGIPLSIAASFSALVMKLGRRRLTNWPSSVILSWKRSFSSSYATMKAVRPLSVEARSEVSPVTFTTVPMRSCAPAGPMGGPFLTGWRSSSSLPSSSSDEPSELALVELAGSCIERREETGGRGCSTGSRSTSPFLVEAVLFHDKLMLPAPSDSSASPSGIASGISPFCDLAAPRHVKLTCSPPRSRSARAASSLLVGRTALVTSRTSSLQSPSSLRSTSISMRVAADAFILSVATTTRPEVRSGDAPLRSSCVGFGP